MRDFATDPEIAEDLIHRARSERDGERSGESMRIGDAAVVAHWPCSGCGAMVPIVRAQVETYERFNRMLEQRRERPLPQRGQCDACRQREREAEQAERDHQHELASKPRQTQMPLEPERPSWMPTPMASRKRSAR